METRTYQKQKIVFVLIVMLLLFAILILRIGYLMIHRSAYYNERALDVQERERKIPAERGIIFDRNGTALAINQSVCTVSVIHNQVTEPERVIEILSKELLLDEKSVRKRVEKKSSIEKIASNVSKEIGDRIRSYKMAGVLVDEDYSRYYPYEHIASKILGFTGGENQGIVGLEVKYENDLQGEAGVLYTLTDVRGVQVENSVETRKDPVKGEDLYISLDYNIQAYITQIAQQVLEQKKAKSVSAILMNPKNGEIYAMVNVPEFNLNEPFILNFESEGDQTKENLLNQMWRN